MCKIHLLIWGILFIFVSGCQKEYPEPEMPVYKYDIGDIAYLKLDSTRVIVIDRWSWYQDNQYKVKYTDTAGYYLSTNIFEFELY